MTTQRPLALRSAEARRRAHSREAARNGTWMPFVPAGPVRQHIEQIAASGMPVAAIGERLGCGPKAFDRLMYASKRPERVRRETAESVLAYWPTIGDYPDSARIDPTGSRRRVQALMARGFPGRYLASVVGVDEKSFSRALQAERVTAFLARSIMKAYDRLWNQQPEAHGVSAAAANWARKVARSRGYAGSLAWDDDTIDDPNAEPLLDADSDAEAYDEVAVRRYADGVRIDLTAAERLDAVVLCVSRGMSYEDIDRAHGHGSSFTSVFVGRMRRAYDRDGRAFPEALAQDMVRVLDEAEVVAIRTRSVAGETDLELGMAYGVRARTIADVCRGRSYRQYGGPIRTPKTTPSQTSKTLFAGKTGQRAA
ncbi:hypothetical protein ACFY8X_38935 [Streptomyces tanashiensis]|uniref:hypothetical protein n=1 Tax=Streptomyces tanashiensis TaxID=67367 RepID=UPI0036E3E78D